MAAPMVNESPAASMAERFATIARRLSTAARAAGLTVPTFRSPPRARGANRTIRHTVGGAVVSVRISGRPDSEIVADMVDGILTVNHVTSDLVRAALTKAVS